MFLESLTSIVNILSSDLQEVIPVVVAVGQGVLIFCNLMNKPFEIF